MAQSSCRSYCSVPCCSNNKHKFPYLSFHDFLANAEIRAQWVSAIKRDEGPSFKILRGSMCAASTFPQRTRIQQRVDELGLEKELCRLDSP